MKIAHVVSGILGGAGRVVHELAAALPAQVRSEAVLFGTAGADPTMVAMLETSCARVSCVTKRAKVDPIAVLELSEALNAASPDVILLHDFTAYVWGPCAARFGYQTPLVAVEHSNILSTALRRAVRRALHPAFSATVCVSPKLEVGLREIGVTRGVRTIENGIEQSRFVGLTDRARFGAGQLRMLMVGRLDAPKDHATLLQAVAQLRQRGVPVRLSLVGDGSLRSALELQIHASKIDDVVRLEGTQSDLAPFLASSDVIVLASRAEGLPISLIEGMAAGCLAIASRVGAVDGLLDGGAAGMLVPPSDPVALAAAIEAAYLDRARAASLASAGARWVASHYDASVMARRYLEVLETCVARR